MKTLVTGKLQEVINHRKYAAPGHILAATDLNDGQYLIPHIVAQARATNASVTLIHAILPMEALPIDASSITYVDTAKLERELQFQLDAMAEKIALQGVQCKTVLQHGFAADVIREQIGLSGAERLLMATHARGKLGQFLLGSVANQLLGSVTIPVFVVGHHPVGHAKPLRILHPVSLASGYEKSLDFAVELARANNAELILLHVANKETEKFIQPGCTMNGVDAISQAILPEGAFLVPPIQVRVAFGNIVEAIQNVTAEKAVDWIVLGVEEEHGSWPFSESTAYKVMAAVDCPVITLRRELKTLVPEKVPEHHVLTTMG